MFAYLATVEGLFHWLYRLKVRFIVVFCAITIISIFTFADHSAEHVDPTDDLSIVLLQFFAFSFSTVILIASLFETLLVFLKIFTFNEIDLDDVFRYGFTISFIINLFCDSLICITFKG